MAEVYYKIDGNNIYYCNVQKSGYQPFSTYKSEGKNVIVELTNDVFTFPDSAAQLFYKATNESFPNITSWNTSQTRSVDGLFYGCTNLKTLDLSNFRLSNCSNAQSMFMNCSSLTSISGFSTIDLSPSFGIADMFNGCSSLVRVDLRGISTSSQGGSGSIFKNCSSLISITANPGTIGISYGGSMYAMFLGCSSLPSLDLSFFYFAGSDSKISFYNAFFNCTSLKSINFGTLATHEFSGVDFQNTFYNCKNLKEVNLADAKGTIVDVDQAFYNCTNLETIHLDKATMGFSDSTYLTSVFAGDTNLKKIYVKEGTDWTNTQNSAIFSGCTKLENWSGDTTIKRANTVENFGYFTGVGEPEPVTTYIKLTDDAWTEVTTAYIKTSARSWKDSTIWK